MRSHFETVVLATKNVWVEEHDAAVVALLVLEQDWIDQLYVDPAHLGNGFGSNLIAVAKRERPRGLRLQ